MERLEHIQKLVDTFKMERIAYIILTTLSALILIGLGIYLTISGKDPKIFLVLLLPTGTLTLCIFRVLKMWDDALKYLSNQNNIENDK